MKVTQYKREDEFAYCLGASPTIELLKGCPEQVCRVLINEKTIQNEAFAYVSSLCSAAGVPIERNDKAFNILSQKENCYVIGVFRKRLKPLRGGNHVVMVNPSDAGNLGTVIRTAAGLSVYDIAIVGNAADVFSPKAVRASMGALFHVRADCFESFDDYRSAFPDNNLYAFMLRRSVPIDTVKFLAPFSLIFGNEASGLPDGFADFTTPVIIPHSDCVDSLSLPMAAGIGIFAATRGK